jgi:nucleotide-binding universal stress UspA family protein
VLAPFHRIIVAVPTGDDAASLVSYAGMLRQRFSAELFPVHVPPNSQRDVEAALPIPCKLLFGPVEDCLLWYASEIRADLMLMGHRIAGRKRKTLVRRLAMNAPCSVWMVPEECQPALSRILAPVDFSPRAADALRVACRIALAAGIESVTGLYVHFEDVVAFSEEVEDDFRSNLDTAFLRFIAPLDLGGIDVMPSIEESSQVVSTILRVASQEESDLIVMSTRGRSRSAAVLLGSVTEETVIQSRRPVLAVKHFGARMGLLKVLISPEVRHGNEQRFG